jgi:hypothetical protein
MSCLSRGHENNSAKTSTQVAPGTFTPASMPARSIIHMLSWLVTYKHYSSTVVPAYFTILVVTPEKSLKHPEKEKLTKMKNPGSSVAPSRETVCLSIVLTPTLLVPPWPPRSRARAISTAREHGQRQKRSSCGAPTTATYDATSLFPPARGRTYPVRHALFADPFLSFLPASSPSALIRSHPSSEIDTNIDTRQKHVYLSRLTANRRTHAIRHVLLLVPARL